MKTRNQPEGANDTFGRTTFLSDECELTGFEEHLRDSEYQGDPRRCPIHPHVKTSSDDGMFDGVCDVCEGEMSDWAAKWDMDPANPHRKQCGVSTTYIASSYPGSRWAGRYAKCTDVVDPDEIPF